MTRTVPATRKGRRTPSARRREGADAGHLFTLAVALHRSSRLDEAIANYRRVIACDPTNFAAHANLGAVLQTQGKLAKAAASYRRAVTLKPDYAEAHSNLGTALQLQGRLDEAMASYARALELNPNDAGTHSNLGVTLRALGRLDEAIDSHRRALALRPDYAEAHNSLGLALQLGGRLDEAVASYARAIALKPDDAKAHNNLGMAFKAQGRIEEAMASYRRALALKPDYADAHNNLGTALQALSRLDEALESYRRAIALAPYNAEMHSNLGLTLQALGRLDEALASHDRAIALPPENAEVHDNRGTVLQLLGRLDDAVAAYRRAIAMKPGLANAHGNLGMALLQLGDFAEGATEYEWRLRPVTDPALPSLEQPLWDGRPLPDGTILLRTEQGLGDAIQFARYAKLVRTRCGRVLLQCPPALARLFETAPGVDRVIAAGAPLPAFEAHAPLLSLIHILDTQLETIPAEVPYLAADPERVAKLRPRIGGAKGLKVGLVWAGNPEFKGDRDRSLASLSMLEPLLGVEGVSFFSLQKGERAGEIAALGLGHRIVDLGPALDDFADTAVAISQLDLVISTCTAVPHLAGALGKPVWTMLPFAADWRWLLEREDSPWYPSMRLFRQKQRGDWPGVVARVADELRGLAASALDPAHASEHAELGAALQAQGKPDAALASYARALVLDPNHIEAHNGLGMALQVLGRADEALESYRRALKLDPSYANAHNNIGSVLQTQGKLIEAVESYRRAIALKPDYARAYSNLGLTLESLGRIDEAAESYGHAVVLEPGYAEAHRKLGTLLQQQGNLDEAIESYRRAIALKPDFAWAHGNLGKALLLRGDFAAGTAEYEWRWRMTAFMSPPGLERPIWDGRPLPGGTILLRTEQGLGDAIQFVRYAPMVRERCGRVLLHCRPRLARLLATAPGVDQVILAGEPLPRFDAHAPLMSLMHILETRHETIPAIVPYLALDPGRVAAFQERVHATGGLKLGLVWGGNPDFDNDRERSLPSLFALEPLLRMEGVTFFSLQKGERAGEIGASELTERIVDLSPALDDVADTAAVISQLDLVISVDTAMAHLAGALGKPVWTLLSFAPDWRWLLGREDSPWYPSMRLFRQTARGDWPGVIGRVAHELRHFAGQRAVHPRPADSTANGAGTRATPSAVRQIRSDKDMFIEAQRHHQGGRLAEAEAIYRRILDGNPDHVGALHYFGVVACQHADYAVAEASIGRALVLAPNYAEAHNSLGNLFKVKGALDKARLSYERALALKPDNAEAHSNLGAILQAEGKPDDAMTCYQRALALKPRQPDTHVNLGNLFQAQGQLEEAVACYHRALEINPDHIEALSNLGTALQAQAKLDEAAESFQRALALRPDHAETESNLGIVHKDRGDLDQARACLHRALALKPDHPGVHSNLGVVLKEEGKLDEAAACFERALALNPNYHEALVNLAATFQAMGRFEDAVASCRRALTLAPDNVGAHCNLGAALQALDRPDEAMEIYRRALALNPKSAEVYSNIGTALQGVGKRDEAIESYRRALELKPDAAGAHLNLALALLQRGDFARGAAEYEWRWRAEGGPRLPRLEEPVWDGRPLPGRTILLRAEQGIGDAIQFVRYAPMVRERCGRVVLHCLPAVAWLFATTPGIDHVIAGDGPMPDFDAHVPLMSLMRILKTGLETIPSTVPYLAADPERVEKLRARIGSAKGLKVGLVWAGNPGYKGDRNRSLASLSMLEPVFGMEGVSFFSLLKGERSQEISALGLSDLIVDLAPALDDFADAAATISQLDLVISVDTAAAHLAGALSKPVWTLLPFASDWRWLLDREGSPWYPTMRLYRQTARGDWPGVIARVADELRRLAASHEASQAARQTSDAPGRAASSGERTAAELAFRSAVALYRSGKLDAAIVQYQRAIAFDPTFAPAHANLGAALHAQGKLDAAVASYARALTLNPNYPEAHNGLGAALQLQGKLNEAAASYARALALAPDYAEAHSNLGAVRQVQGRLEEAIESYRRAVALKPDNAVAHGNLGAALQEKGRLREALASYHRALARAPDNVEAHNGLGVVLQALGRIDEALESYRLAVAFNPDHARARRNLGMALLLRGDFAAGTAEYEWRLRVSGGGTHTDSLKQPLWDGRSLPGGTVLLRTEQGLGDAIQFVRYAKLVRARCGRVLLQCPPALARLFETASGIDQVIAGDVPLPDLDAHAPLLSLMRILDTRLETIPAEVPYLAADPERVAKPRPQIGAAKGLKVGLVWAGNPDFKGDRDRSLASLSVLEPLLGVEGVSFFSLQKGERAGEIGALGLSERIVDLAPALDDFADTAAAISELDLVISTCTAVPHLAGALGKPVWTLLPFAADWRWLLGREDTPWYPSMRLFRQKVRGHWPSVIARVAHDLCRYSRQKRRPTLHKPLQA